MPYLAQYPISFIFKSKSSNQRKSCCCDKLQLNVQKSTSVTGKELFVRTIRDTIVELVALHTDYEELMPDTCPGKQCRVLAIANNKNRKNEKRHRDRLHTFPILSIIACNIGCVEHAVRVETRTACSILRRMHIAQCEHFYCCNQSLSS